MVRITLWQIRAAFAWCNGCLCRKHDSIVSVCACGNSGRNRSFGFDAVIKKHLSLSLTPNSL